MFNANLLKSEIARNGMTQKSVAEALGITPVTFSKKMKTGSFGLSEAEQMIRLLGIRNPCAIFFGHE